MQSIEKADDTRLTSTQNIEKAQKEIDRLEKEAVDSVAEPGPKPNGRRRDAAKKPAIDHHGMNGGPSAESELAQETDAAADVAEDLKAAKIEDANQPDEAPEAEA